MSEPRWFRTGEEVTTEIASKKLLFNYGIGWGGPGHDEIKKVIVIVDVDEDEQIRLSREDALAVIDLLQGMVEEISK